MNKYLPAEGRGRGGGSILFVFKVDEDSCEAVLWSEGKTLPWTKKWLKL